VATPPRAKLGLVLAFLAYASWGLLSPVGKHLLLDFHPFALNAIRFVLATAVFLACIGPMACVTRSACCAAATCGG